MSRNINKSNEIIFENIKLAYYCSDAYQEDESLNKKRYISGSKAERDWLEHFHIELDNYIHFWNDNYFLFGSYKNKKYLVTIGLDDILTLPNGITDISINAGQFLAVIADIGLMIRKEYPPLRLANNILSQHLDSEGYKGHDFTELLPLFPAINIFFIDEKIYAGDIKSLDQLSCFILIQNKDILRLPYNDETLNSFKQLCYQNFSYIKYENLFQALTATSFKFAFLDIYRSIEMLYQLYYIIDIENEIQGIDREKLLKAIDTSLNWRPNERNTFIKILNSIHVTNRAYITKKLPGVIKRTTGNSVVKNDALWNWIYDLRCSIVHLKTYHHQFKISNKDWDIIIHGLLDVITAAYRKL